jgi:hypothetical protein
MIQRLLAGAFAVGFVLLVERASARRVVRRRPDCLVTATLLASMLALGVAPQPAIAADAKSKSSIAAGVISPGTVVRVSSTGIEAGWFRGRMVLDGRQCWMVQLNQATKDGYTMLALSFVAAVEVATDGGWTPVALQPVVAAQPAECLEEGAD